MRSSIIGKIEKAKRYALLYRASQPTFAERITAIS